MWLLEGSLLSLGCWPALQLAVLLMLAIEKGYCHDMGEGSHLAQQLFMRLFNFNYFEVTSKARCRSSECYGFLREHEGVLLGMRGG